MLCHGQTITADCYVYHVILCLNQDLSKSLTRAIGVVVITKAPNGIVLECGLVGKCLCVNYYSPVCTLVIDIMNICCSWT